MAQPAVIETTAAVRVQRMTSGKTAADVTDVTRPTALTQTAQGDGDVWLSGCEWISGSEAIAAAISRTQTRPTRRIGISIL